MKIEFTEPQVNALITALGNSTDFPDVFESVFNQNLREINTCIRAENKLREAVNRPINPEWEALSYSEE